jgi:mevalonate kinase
VCRVLSLKCSIAPAKVILFGEHFVVKGKPALGLAVNVYAKVCVKEGSGRVYSRQLGEVSVRSPQRAIFDTALEEVSRFTGKSGSLDVYVDSAIPVAAGMGSSASIAVALVHALLVYYGVEFSKEDVRRLAHEAEKAVHYKPSGVDTTLSTYGGLLYYKQGEFRLLSDLKLPSDLSIVVVDTGVKRNTGIIVKEVLERYERCERVLKHVYEAAGEIVELAIEAIKNSDKKLLGELMLINHGLLWSISTSSRVCDEVVYTLLELGALGCKISGAGRGGVVIGLVERNTAESTLSRLVNMGLRAFLVEPDYAGVRTAGS